MTTIALVVQYSHTQNVGVVGSPQQVQYLLGIIAAPRPTQEAQWIAVDDRRRAQGVATAQSRLDQIGPASTLADDGLGRTAIHRCWGPFTQLGPRREGACTHGQVNLRLTSGLGSQWPDGAG